MRINLACQLLMDEALSVTDICYKVGFNNLSNFNRQFRVAKGMAPSRFRRYQQLNEASRDVCDEATGGAGVENAPSIVPAAQVRSRERTGVSASHPAP
jgi:AraC-like DNA-binding protein